MGTFKPLPKVINGWEIIKDLGMKEINSINNVSGNNQRKHYVRIRCPKCGKENDRELGNIKSHKKIRCTSDICKIGDLGRRYQGMIARCYNPEAKSYKTHGAIGIGVCKEWLEDRDEFIQWAKTHGYKPELFLDRKDNTKSYTPKNCRWVTPSESCLNRKIFKNNSTGYTGITLYKNPRSSKNRFQVRIGTKKIGKLKKYCDTLEEAIIVREQFIKRLGLEDYYYDKE